MKQIVVTFTRETVIDNKARELADALAHSAGGRVAFLANDKAGINVPDDDCEDYLKELCDDDGRVISYTTL